MATLIIYPVDELNKTAGVWAADGASTTWEAVDDVGAHDNDTTRIINADPTAYDDYILWKNDSFSPVAGTITDVKIIAYGKVSSGVLSLSGSYQKDGVRYGTSAGMTLGTSYTLLSASLPITVQNWQSLLGTAGVNNLDGFGIWTNQAKTTNLYITQCYLEVTYTPIVGTGAGTFPPLSGTGTSMTGRGESTLPSITSDGSTTYGIGILAAMTGIGMSAAVLTEDKMILLHEGAKDILASYLQGATPPTSFELSIFHVNPEYIDASVNPDVVKKELTMNSLVYEQTGAGYSRLAIPRSSVGFDVFDTVTGIGVASQQTLTYTSTGKWTPFNCFVLNSAGADKPAVTATLTTTGLEEIAINGDSIVASLNLSFLQAEDQIPPNGLTVEGIQNITEFYFKNVTPPSGFEIALFHDAEMSENKILATLDSEVTGSGYSRQTLGKAPAYWTISNGWAESVMVTFVPTGNWSPFNTIVLLGTGIITPLIAYVTYEEDIALVDGDILEVVFIVDINTVEEE